MRRNEGNDDIEVGTVPSVDSASSRASSNAGMMLSLTSSNGGKNSPTTSKKQSGFSKFGAVAACALYSSCSVSMVLVNKSLASR